MEFIGGRKHDAERDTAVFTALESNCVQMPDTLSRGLSERSV